MNPCCGGTNAQWQADSESQKSRAIPLRVRDEKVRRTRAATGRIEPFHHSNSKEMRIMERFAYPATERFGVPSDTWTRKTWGAALAYVLSKSQVFSDFKTFTSSPRVHEGVKHTSTLVSSKRHACYKINERLHIITFEAAGLGPFGSHD
jgi:hypothetical protein